MSRRRVIPPPIHGASPRECIEALMDAGWSQAAIARALQCQRTTICRIASGKTPGPDYRIVDGLRLMAAASPRRARANVAEQLVVVARSSVGSPLSYRTE